MRGGISCICKWHNKSENKYTRSNHKNKRKKFISYWDANNLHGWAMSQALPYGEFDWLSKKEINGFCLNSISDSSVGCFLEVDLEYPDELHDLHIDYPLAPEKLEIIQDIVLIVLINME